MTLKQYGLEGEKAVTSLPVMGVTKRLPALTLEERYCHPDSASNDIAQFGKQKNCERYQEITLLCLKKIRRNFNMKFSFKFLSFLRLLPLSPRLSDFALRYFEFLYDCFFTQTSYF